jgi:hypothetical protein
MKEKPQDKSECLKRAAEVRRFPERPAIRRRKQTCSPLSDDGACWASRRKKKWSHVRVACCLTSSTDRFRKPAMSWIDMPRARASQRKNRSALSHGGRATC